MPLTTRLAVRLDAIDRPNARALHEQPTPKLGGLAILAGVLVAGLIWLPWDAESRAILGGAVLIAAVGMVDDIYELRGGPEAARADGGWISPSPPG